MRCARDFGVRPVSVGQKKVRKHIFTHIEWLMTCYFIDCETRDVRFVWADARMLDEELALPSAFGKLL
jgi:A/G-specific adenine glycosylase